jgi:hypothetical protein
MAKGKGKGSSQERAIARKLTMWASGQEKDLWYWRSPSSGATFTANLDSKVMAGDIIALKPEASPLTNLFSIEIKCGYPNTDMFQFFKSKCKFNIEQFWKQCCNDAFKADKYPMLFYKKDR